MIFRNRDVLRLPAATDNTEHSIAGFPRAHFVADLLNFAGEFNSGNVLRITGRRRIAAEALQDIGAVQSCGTHADTDAIESCARSIRDLAKLEAFDAAE
jgi:hypothetical protein